MNLCPGTPPPGPPTRRKPYAAATDALGNETPTPRCHNAAPLRFRVALGPEDLDALHVRRSGEFRERQHVRRSPRGPDLPPAPGLGPRGAPQRARRGTVRA